MHHIDAGRDRFGGFPSGPAPPVRVPGGCREFLFYGEHAERPFFPGLVGFITSAPIVAMVWEAENAVEVVRNTMGGTNPADSPMGTIRGDLALDIGRNLVHGSDGPESAQREIELFFKSEEILEYGRSNDSWIIEP